jgi:hypothetical protein
MPNILIKTQRRIKLGRLFQMVPLPDVSFSVTNISTNAQTIHRTNERGEFSLNMPNGSYRFFKEAFGTFFPIHFIETIPLSIQKNSIEINFIDNTAECYYLKRRIAHLIGVGTDKSLAKAEQMIAQIKYNHQNYQENPLLHFVTRLEHRLQNNWQEMDGRMAIVK